MKGKTYRVINRMYESSRSAVLLNGEKSKVFLMWSKGLATQGCITVGRGGVSWTFCVGNNIGWLSFADGFVGLVSLGNSYKA